VTPFAEEQIFLHECLRRMDSAREESSLDALFEAEPKTG